MKNIENNLDKIEKRLQSLIEGSSSKFFQSSDRYNLLNQKIVSALKDSIKQDVEGKFFAPEMFLIKVNQDQVDDWLADQQTLDSTALYIKQYANEEGIYFESTPVLEVVPDLEIAFEDFQVELRFRGKNVTRTTAIPIESEQFEFEIPSEAYLIVDGTEVYSCNQQTIKIGRHSENHLVIDDRRVSRQHAQIKAIKGNFVIFDLNSSGGTFVNGERVNQRVLHAGDVISLAGVPLVYGQEKPAQENTQHMTVEI